MTRDDVPAGSASATAAEAVSPGSVTEDLDGDGRLSTIEQGVSRIHETLNHVAEMIEHLSEQASGPAKDAAEPVTGDLGSEHDSSPVRAPWTHRKIP